MSKLVAEPQSSSLHYLMKFELNLIRDGAERATDRLEPGRINPRGISNSLRSRRMETRRRVCETESEGFTCSFRENIR